MTIWIIKILKITLYIIFLKELKLEKLVLGSLIDVKWTKITLVLHLLFINVFCEKGKKKQLLILY